MSTKIIITSALGIALTLMGCDGGGTTQHGAVNLEGTLDTALVDYKSDSSKTVYFDFSTGTKTVIAADAWDLAISTTDASVIANCGLYGAGVRLYKSTSTDIAADLTSLADSVAGIIDSSSNPLAGAYNIQGAGNDTVFLVKDQAGVFYKIQFESFGPAGKFSLLLAKGLAGTANTLTGTLEEKTDHVYLDLGTAKEVTQGIPQEDSWDIRFVRALEFFQGPAGFGPRSAIQLNSAKGVKANLIGPVAFDSVTTMDSNSLSVDPNAIGAGWYVSVYDQATHISTVTVPVQTYVIQTTEGDLVKVQFLTFYGPNNEGFYTVFKWISESNM